MDGRIMKIKHVTTWCGALTLTGAGALLLLHAAGVIATPSDRMALSAAPSYDEPALLRIEIAATPIPPDVQAIGLVPEPTAAASAPANRSDEQRHTQTAQVHRGPNPMRGFKHRLPRDSGNLRINSTRSHDVGIWLLTPSQGGGQN